MQVLTPTTSLSRAIREPQERGRHNVSCSTEFLPAEARCYVPIDHAGRLHERVANRRTHEAQVAAKLAGAYVPGPPVVIELTFADGTPVHALQAVDEEP